MFLPPDSFRVIPTEEDAKRCSSFSPKDDNNEHLRSFKEEGIQRHYEYFLIQRASRTFVVLAFGMFVLFATALYSTFTDNGDIWVMRSLLIVRLLVLLLVFYIYYKIFHARVYPDRASREEFHQYVNVVTTLSNVVVITLACVNGVAYVWKTSLGSCLEVDSTGEEFRNSRAVFYYDCNPSHELGTTPTESMVMLIVGNLLCIATLRSHSYWATWINYVVTVLCVIVASAISPLPLVAFPEFVGAITSIFTYNVMENTSRTLFKALLELEATNRVKTTELKHFIGNVAHDLKVFSVCVYVCNYPSCLIVSLSWFLLNSDPPSRLHHVHGPPAVSLGRTHALRTGQGRHRRPAADMQSQLYFHASSHQPHSGLRKKRF
jgi:hypothetical protein